MISEMGMCAVGDLFWPMGGSLQQQCAEQTRRMVDRSMASKGRLNLTLRYLLRGCPTPPPLYDPERTALSGRPWTDVQ